MKTFNKVLALVLTLITVVAMLPISAFADAWVSVDSKTEGSSSTVTLTLDAGALADILERDGISPSLLQDIKAGISVDVNALREAFTVEELLEIIPRESWLNIFDVEEIVEAIGLEELSKYVDISALLKAADSAELAHILATVEDIENDINIAGLLEKGYIDVDLLLKHTDTDGLMTAIDYNVLKTELAKLTEDEFLAIMDWDEVVAAALEMADSNNIVKHPIVLCDTDVLCEKLAVLCETEGALFNSYVGGTIYEQTMAQMDNDTKVALELGGYLANGKLDLKKMVDDGVQSMEDAAALLDLQQMMIDRVIEPTEVLRFGTNFKDNALASLTANQMKRVMILNDTTLDMVVKSVGGYGVVKTFVNVSELLDDKDLSLSALLDAIHDNNEELTSYIYFDTLLHHVTIGQLLDVVPASAIVAEIDNNEILDLIQLINVKQYIIPVLTLVADKVLVNIDKVAIDGAVVAEESEDDGLLKIYASALVKAVANMIPTLTEFAAVEDGTVFSTTLDLLYTVDGTATQKNKSITFEIVVEGDLTRLQNAATKLSELLHRYINEFSVDGGVVTLDVTVPATVTKLYAKALDLDAIPDALKVKVLDLVNLNGDRLVAFTESLTWEEIIQILDSVEPSALYNTVLNHEYVALVLEKVEAKTGYDLSSISLDELVDAAANVPSLERICEVLESKTGRDVMSYIETLAIKVDSAADRVEQIAAVQKILDKVGARFNVDVTEFSAEEILDRAKDAPISETISNIIAAKIGVDVRAVLENYTVDELYQKAVDKAATLSDEYNKVKNFILAKADLIPDRLMAADIADLYLGDGVFGGAKSVTGNPKALVEKVLKKAFSVLNLNENALDLIFDRIQGGENLTVGLDLAIRFQNLHEIKYMSRDGEKVLFRAYLPADADLTVFKNNPEVTGYDFVGWTDKDGNEVNYMPNEDTVVYADRNAWQLTFEDEAGNVLGMIMLPKGDTLGDLAENLDEIEAKVELPTDVNVDLYDGYRVGWYQKGDANKRLVFRGTEITKDMTLVVKPIPNYFLSFDVDVDYDVAIEKNDGAYDYILTVNTALPEGFVLDLDRAHLLTRANGEDSVSLTMNIAEGDYTFFSIDDKTLADFYNRANESVAFSYAPADEMLESFAGTYYENAKGAAFFSFDLLADGVASHDKFATPLTIQLPYAGAIVNKVGEKTNVYTVANGNRELATTKVVQAEDGNTYVQFTAKHFSDFVVANEVLLDLTFVTETGKSVAASLKNDAGNGTYFPAGAAITLAFDLPTGYKLVKIESEGKELAENSVFTMPETSVSMKVTLKEGVYYIYYYVNGKLTASQEYEASKKNEVKLKEFADVVGTAKPADTTVYATTGTWAGYDETKLGEADMFLFADWALISYTVTYLDQDGKEVQKFTGITAENYTTELTVPAVPEVTGKVYKWGTPAVDSTKATATVSMVFVTDLTYNITTDGNVSAAPKEGVYNTEITVTPVEKTGYNAVVTVVPANGASFTVSGGKFNMPASDVHLTVTYEPKTLNYTVNGVSKTGTYGDSVSFTVNVNNGELLTSVTNGCELVSISTDMDGNKTMTYTFKLTADNMAITWTKEGSELALFRIFNGKLFNGTTDPESDVKNVEFAGWSETVASTLQFATFTLTKATSLLWLWILLIILLFIALIVLIYVLHITGKIGVNFLTRFACWLVGLFFALCLAVSALGLKIAGLFGKGDKPEDYGFEKEEQLPEENAEATSEEVTEENAESAETDAAAAVVAEEATEEVAEEATEETTEEAPAEEATEETTEEAPAEEATEETTEEAPAEEATEETTEEAPAEEATEETTEEAPAEEATEETTEEAPAEEVTEETTEEAPAEEVTEETTEEAPAEEATEETTEEAPAEETSNENSDEEKKENE